jgi:hypothetical protein
MGVSVIKTIILTLVVLSTITAGYVIGHISLNKRNISSVVDAETTIGEEAKKRLDQLYVAVEQNRGDIEAIGLRNREAFAELSQKIDAIGKLDISAQDTVEATEDTKPSFEEEMVEFEQKFQQEQAEYENEPMDFNWAPQAEIDLEMGLKKYESQLKFELVNFECRTTRCQANVVFENYELAQEHGNRLAEIALPGLNCSQSVYLPIPNDTSMAYQAKLLLDCRQLIHGHIAPTY